MAGFCIQTFDALASANELAALVVMNVVGEEVANSVEGSELTRAQVFAMTQSKVQAQFATKLEN